MTCSIFADQKQCMTEEDMATLVNIIVKAHDSHVFVKNETHLPKWDVIGSIFFAATVVTTIGKNKNLLVLKSVNVSNHMFDGTNQRFARDGTSIMQTRRIITGLERSERKKI